MKSNVCVDKKRKVGFGLSVKAFRRMCGEEEVDTRESVICFKKQKKR